MAPGERHPAMRTAWALRAPFWLAIAAAACGSTGSTSSSAGSAGASSTGGQSSTTANTESSSTTSPGASPTVACGPTSGGAQTGPFPQGRATITDVRTGTGDGYDRMVVEFDRVVPAYRIAPNPTGTHFIASASGMPITLAGSFAMKLDISNLDLPNRYPHGTDQTPSSLVLKEVRVVGDFEGVATFGIGLGANVCPNVSTMIGPPRLVIDFPTR
jgi:hypothetical protein